MKPSDLSLSLNNGESNLEIDQDIISLSKKPVNQDQNEDGKGVQLQRTTQWKIDKVGNWGASKMKNLMSCSSKGGKLDWSDNEKIFEFSSGIIKFIYSVAMERKTKKFVETANSYAMRFGTKVEPLLFNYAAEKLLEEGIIIENVGFKKFPRFTTAGASSDFLGRKDGIPVLSGEQKSCASWDGHYERTFELMDEKSGDFWQTQSQMIAWNVKKCLYVVSEPPADITKYIFCDDIEELADEFYAECPISLQWIDASPIHQNAVISRIEIVEKVVSKWLAGEEHDLKELFWETVKEEKEKFFNELPKQVFNMPVGAELEFLALPPKETEIQETEKTETIKEIEQPVKELTFKDIAGDVTF